MLNCIVLLLSFLGVILTGHYVHFTHLKLLLNIVGFFFLFFFYVDPLPFLGNTGDKTMRTQYNMNNTLKIGFMNASSRFLC